MSYITVIGAGSWGTTVAALLAQKDYDVALQVHEEDLADEIKKTRINKLYCPDVRIPDSVNITWKLNKALRNARYIVSAVPTQHTRAVLKEALPHIPDGAIFVSLSKGIEMGTYMTVSAIIKEVTKHRVAVLSGPSFAKEVALRLPTAVTLATDDYSAGLLLQEMFTTDYFRVYTHYDVMGVELGGALKNVVAIAAGVSDGLGLGNNARAALITRGLAEMTRLGVMMGAKEHTFYGLSGMGDLVLTCTSALSRNYTFGVRLGKGEKAADILSSTKSVAEGVASAKAINELSRLHRVEMPIVEQVHKLIYEGATPLETVNYLMNRSPKAEFHG